MPMVALRPLDEVDLVAGGQGHHGLLPVRPAPGEAAHALELALVGRRADGGHLDVEHRLDGGADLDLVGVGTHAEGHGVPLLLLPHRLLGHDRPVALVSRLPQATAARSASRRISRGIALSCERGVGPKGLPPPFHCVARIEPWRARPVPFCFHGFLPPPETSLRPFVSCVPARRSASSRTTAWCSRGTRISTPKTSALSSTAPLSLPFASTTFTLGITSSPRPSAAAPWWS